MIIEKAVLFQEVTSGPFIKDKTIYAKWSPEEKNVEEVKNYLLKLKKIANRS